MLLWKEELASVGKPGHESIREAWERLFNETFRPKEMQFTDGGLHKHSTYACPDGRTALIWAAGYSEIHMYDFPYLTVDVETTGLNPLSCQILEICVIYDNIPGSTKIAIKNLPRYHRIIKHDRLTIEQGAASMNWKRIDWILNGIEYEGRPGEIKPDDLDDELTAWVRRYFPDPAKPICLAGKGPQFDVEFMRRAGVTIPFHRRFLDPTMLYFDPKVDSVPPGLKLCCDRIGLTLNAHNAADDAEAVIALIRGKFLWGRLESNQPNAQSMLK